MSRLISVDEVKKHKDKSIWMIIHNDVYDVTEFLNEHPGGADSLLDYAGQDGTQGFEDVGHSSDAREMMKKYKIGTLPAAERNKFIETCCKKKSKKKISCPRLPKTEPSEKTWRTYDGSSSSRSIPKSEYRAPPSAMAERRVQAIVVPRERQRPRRPSSPPPSSSNLKWALLALAGAVVIGIVLKKYMV